MSLNIRRQMLHRPAEKVTLVTVDPNYQPYDPSYRYGFSITLNGTVYHYMSNTLFYMLDNKNGTYTILMGETVVRVPSGIARYPLPYSFSNIDSSVGYYETYSRNAAAVATMVSNVPIWLVELVTNHYEYVTQ